MAVQLPVELMIKILDYLPHRDRMVASATCSLWHDICFTSKYSMNQYVFIQGRHNKDSTFYTHLLNLFSKSYFGHPSFTFKNLDINVIPQKFWTRHSETLKNLHFYRCRLYMPGWEFLNILRTCKHLDSLSFTSCKGLVNLITELDTKLAESPQDEPFNITKLAVYDNTSFTDGLFFQFVKNLRLLEELDVSPCTLAYSAPHICPSDNSLRLPYVNVVLQHCNNFFKEIVARTSLKSDFFKLLESPNIQLKSLDLNKYTTSVDDLKFVIKRNTSLTRLSLANNYTLTNAMLKTICENLQSLKYLNISNSHVSNLGMGELTAAKNLNHLNISYCKNVTSDGIEQLCRVRNHTMRELKITSLRIEETDIILISYQFPNLVLLNMSDCERAITNFSIQAVMKNLVNLHTLYMNYCSRVTDDGLIGMYEKDYKVLIKRSPMLYNLKRLKSLKFLSMTYGALTDSTLMHAFESKKLMYVDLSYCRRITHQGIKEMVRKCPNIESLNLRSCEGVIDTGVREIVKNLKNLMFLILTGCALLTNDSIFYIKSRCKCLRVLDVARCRNINPKLAESVYSLPTVHTVLFGDDFYF